MSICGVHHLQLAFRVGTEAAVRHFYRDLLGLSELPEDARPQGAMLRFAVGSQHLDLVGMTQWQPLSAGSHLALAVQDLPALRARLQAAQLPLLENRSVAGHVRLYLKDPAGNQLEFLESAAASVIH